MTDPLPTAPNVVCPVCHARPRQPCTDVTGMPHPPGHAERDETTPTADAIEAEAADDRPVGLRLRAFQAVLGELTRELAAMIRLEERHPEPEPLPEVERVDRYNIRLNGLVVRATERQEAMIRGMDAEARARFVTVMGGRP